MTLKEVESYKDLEVYLQREIYRMLAEQVPVEIRLDDKWFFKLAKLISVSMKGSESPDKARQREAPSCKVYYIKINNVGCKITR